MAARQSEITRVREQLGYLVQNPDIPDRADRIEAMVTSPEPIIGLMSEWIGTGTADLGPLLEVFTRRYYRSRELENVRLFQHGTRQMVTADFDLNAHRLYLINTVGDFSELHALAAAVGEVAAETRPSRGRWWWTSSCPGRTPRRTRIRSPPRCATRWPRCRCPTRCDGSPSVSPANSRPARTT